jgi:hemolysin III
MNAPMSNDSASAAAKPTLRGVLHERAAFVAAGAGAVLVSISTTLRAAVGSGVFALSLISLFTVSAAYHRITWQPVQRAWMRRADHASIFILIAGSYTPIALLALPPALGTRLSWIVWGGATLGVVQSLFWVHAPKVVTALLAVAVGWSIVLYFREVMQAVPTGILLLIALGGVAYTVGAIAYALKRPNLVPGVFGYHELFHALTLVGAGLHFAGVLQLVRHATA